MTPKTTDEPTAPQNVVAALNRVIADLPGIGKDQTAAAGQGGYAYRGIESIVREAQPLFAKYGVVFAPRVVGHEIRDITVANKPWTDTILQVAYTVYGPGGVEDFIEVGPLLAIGRDNSDKGANKAMTQAYKYALLQTLCIADSKDDADGVAHEAEHAPPDPEVAARQALAAVIFALTDDQRIAIREFCDEQGIPRTTAAMTPDQRRRVGEFIETLKRVESQDADAAPSQDPTPEHVETGPANVETIAAEQVAAMDGPTVVGELGKRGLPTTGNEAARRSVLTAALVKEAEEG